LNKKCADGLRPVLPRTQNDHMLVRILKHRRRAPPAVNHHRSGRSSWPRQRRHLPRCAGGAFRLRPDWCGSAGGCTTTAPTVGWTGDADRRELGFVPYHSHETAPRLDLSTAEAIEQGEWASLGSSRACGWVAVAGLLIETRRRGLGAYRSRCATQETRRARAIVSSDMEHGCSARRPNKREPNTERLDDPMGAQPESST